MVQHDSLSLSLACLKNASISEKGYIVLFSFVLNPYLIYVLRAIFVRLGLSSVIDSMINAVWIIVIFASIGVFRNKMKVFDVLFVLSLIGLYYLSCSIYPERILLFKEFEDVFIFSCVPLYFMGVALDYNRFRNTLYWSSVLAIILSIFFYFSMSSGIVQGEVSDENMAMSYNILLPVLIVLLYTLENRNMIDILFSIISSFYLISLGTRGPVLCLIFFVCGYLLIFKNFKNNIVTKTIIIGIAAIGYSFVEIICLTMIGITSALGLSSRVFDSILTNSFANYEESNSRDDIAETVIEYIKKDDTGFGYGLMGDRTLTHYGNYSHNFELEMLISFGKIGGTILLVLFFYCIIKSFIKTKNTPACLILFVLFCSSILQLQFSNSFISCPWLYLYVGFIVSSLRICKKQSYV